MSTAQPAMNGRDTNDTGPGESPHRSRAKRALRLFDDLLFENPEICSECYARIRDHTDLGDHAADRLGTNPNKPTETLERAGAGTVGQDCRDMDSYGVKRDYYARTYCDDCGSPGGTTAGDTDHSLQTMLRNGDSIVRRLHELGWYPDVEAFYTALRTLKTDPDNQGRDRNIYAVAVYLALKRGRKAPDVPSTVRPGRETDTNS